MNCTSEDKYTTNGQCCDRCPAGSYMQAKCDGTKKTKCAECGRGLYTATKNHLDNCLPCNDCSSMNLKKVKDCTAQENAVCECVPGFYCINDQCDHCRNVKDCILGQGVKVNATRTNDTICAPCENGTYSNVTDFHSPCRKHTRCEDIGRVVETPGTATTDAICGNFNSHCPWLIPAGLWSGLVLTALILFGLLCWRAKRKSHRASVHCVTCAASSNVPVALIEMIPAQPACLLRLPLPSTEQNGHCQENGLVEDCKLPLFDSDDNMVSCSIEDSVDSSAPITLLKSSVSFAETKHTNGSAGYGAGNFLRTYSEPQEDEWCGT